jgi:hypothetical protein
MRVLRRWIRWLGSRVVMLWYDLCVCFLCFFVFVDGIRGWGMCCGWFYNGVLEGGVERAL